MLGIMAGAPGVSEAGPATSGSAFMTRIGQYMALRRQVEQRVAGPSVSDDRAEIHRAAGALAEGIRAARQRASQGDIFTTRIAAGFRRIIEMVSRKEQPGVTLAEARRRVSGVAAPALAVNGLFDWNLDAVMPPFLIEALPPLPKELQYRLVGCDLVVVDVTAGLVVDILPRALTTTC
jgi:hypothetical protein